MLMLILMLIQILIWLYSSSYIVFGCDGPRTPDSICTRGWVWIGLGNGAMQCNNGCLSAKFSY